MCEYGEGEARGGKGMCVFKAEGGVIGWMDARQRKKKERILQVRFLNTQKAREVVKGYLYCLHGCAMKSGCLLKYKRKHRKLLSGSKFENLLLHFEKPTATRKSAPLLSPLSGVCVRRHSLFPSPSRSLGGQTTRPASISMLQCTLPMLLSLRAQPFSSIYFSHVLSFSPSFPPNKTPRQVMQGQ